jgi:hypothetical protein
VFPVAVRHDYSGSRETTNAKPTHKTVNSSSSKTATAKSKAKSKSANANGKTKSKSASATHRNSTSRRPSNSAGKATDKATDKATNVKNLGKFSEEKLDFSGKKNSAKQANPGKFPLDKLLSAATLLADSNLHHSGNAIRNPLLADEVKEAATLLEQKAEHVVREVKEQMIIECDRGGSKGRNRMLDIDTANSRNANPSSPIYWSRTGVGMAVRPKMGLLVGFCTAKIDDSKFADSKFGKEKGGIAIPKWTDFQCGKTGVVVDPCAWHGGTKVVGGKSDRAELVGARSNSGKWTLQKFKEIPRDAA